MRSTMVASLLLLQSLFAPIYGEANEGKECYSAAISGLNVRKGPGIKYEIVGKLKCGTRLTVIEKSDGWVCVGLGEGSPSRYGWVSEKYLSVEKPDCSASEGGVLGEWLESAPGLPRYDHAIVIRKTSNGYVMETHYKDGSSDSTELIEYYQNGERRFKEPGGNDYDEYYVIEEVLGGLRMYDREGYIKTAPRLADRHREMLPTLGSQKAKRITGSGNVTTQKTERVTTQKTERVTGSDNGYVWNRSSNEARVSLCKDIARRIGKNEWQFYYDCLNEFYNTENPNLLNQQIATVAGMASVMR